MKNKILVTGADGNLGRQLIDIMRDMNYNYLGISRAHSRENLIKCDITNSKQISKIIMKFKPNIIIHLAGITGNIECEANPNKTIETNVMGTFYILEAIKNKKIKLIFASSREVYGDCNSKVNENDFLNPNNLNGITKMISENLIINYNLKYKIPFNILRFTNFYGENNEKRGISKMIKSSLIKKKITIFGGNQKIDLIHFDDAVNAIIKTIEHKKNGIYNIGFGKSIKLLSLIKILENKSKIKINFQLEKSRHVDTQKFSVNVLKAKKELGFEAKITPKIAIKRMVTKWKKN